MCLIEEDDYFGLDLGCGGEVAFEGDGLKGEAAGATEAARAPQLALPPGYLAGVILLLRIPKEAGDSAPNRRNAAGPRDLGTRGGRGRGRAGGGMTREDVGLVSGRYRRRADEYRYNRG